MRKSHMTTTGSALERPTDSILGMGYALLISAEQTGGQYELMKFTVPGRQGPPPHVHHNEEECFYVIDGEFDVRIGDATVHAKPGSYIHMPRNVAHGFRNTTDSTGSFLCWVMPGNLAGFFDAFK